MKNDDIMGLIIVLGIIFLALFGGATKSRVGGGGLFSTTPVSQTIGQTPEQKQANIEQQIQQTQVKVEELKKQVQAEEDKKNDSIYKGMINLSYPSRSTDPSQEYIAMNVSGTQKTPINITGWTIHSTNTGSTVTIPQGTYLYFQKTKNSEEDIYVVPGDTIYLITGTSPLGVSFKNDKCSGYLSQFQTFTPYLYTSCPTPQNENLSSIQKIAVNDACFDYLQAYPSCHIETGNLPNNFSYECRHFIENTLNYPSCINLHKGDKDFYGHEWRIYLKRNTPIWKNTRENIVLYDKVGKVVSTLTY